MMPYDKINVGDRFKSLLLGSDLTYTVVDKSSGLIEIEPSYQHTALPKTIWRKPSDRIFTRRIFRGLDIP